MTNLLVLAHGSRRDESSIEIGELAARLRNSIVVLAYFLSAGRHVMTDIPEQVRQVSCRPAKQQDQNHPIPGGNPRELMSC